MNDQNLKMRIEMSEDRNTLTVDGIKYEPKDWVPQPLSCQGCDLETKNGQCSIAIPKRSDARIRCGTPARDKDIVWVKVQE